VSPPSPRPNKYQERVPAAFMRIARAAERSKDAGRAVAGDFLLDRGGIDNWLVRFAMARGDPGLVSCILDTATESQLEFLGLARPQSDPAPAAK
jgi:hypothetical protein